MRVIIAIVGLAIFSSSICFGDVVLYHYIDKVTGGERGICYSDKDGNPAVTNSDWDMEIIDEKYKDYYVNLQRKQLEEKQEERKTEKTRKKDKTIKKLEQLGFTPDEIEGLF